MYVVYIMRVVNVSLHLAMLDGLTSLEPALAVAVSAKPKRQGTAIE